MKQVFHKIMSLLMAVVVLLSTMSFTIDMHFCGDVLVETSIFSEVKTCGMDMLDSSKKDCSTAKKNCCSEKQIVIEGQDELKISFDNLTFDQQLFVVSIVNTYLHGFELLEEKPDLLNLHPSPDIVRPIYKFDEVYLI